MTPPAGWSRLNDGLYVYLITALLLLISSTNGVDRIDSELDLDSTLSLHVVHLITSQEYETALGLADSILNDGNHAMQGWFLRATILNSRATDFEDEIDDESLLEACDSVSAICRQLIAGGDNSAIVRFYMGSVTGYLSFKVYKRNKIMKAVSYGRKMAGWYEEAIACDSSCYDAYLGLGSYYYYSSDRAGILRSLGLISDRREEGLRLIRICAERGTFSRLAARSNLAWLAISQEDYDTALRISEQLLEKYPESRAFLWCLGKAQKEAGNWGDAVETYQTLLSSVRRESRNNRYNEVGCLHSLVKAHVELGNWREVVALSDEALKLELTLEVAARKAKDIKRLNKLRREGLKKLGE